MGKKRGGTRQQVRRVVKAKPPVQPAAPQTRSQQRKTQAQYVRSGGMLQGYAPELVARIGLYALIAAVICLLIGVAMLLFLPYGWPVRIAAAIVWIIPIALMAAFLLPGIRLARADRRAEPKLIQGQLLGASEVSQALGLGTLMIKTRGGQEQFLVQPEKLAKVPGNQVPVMLSVTPNLRHVASVGVMGQRMVPRPQQPVPEVLKRLRLLPIVTPLALVAAAILGDDVTASLPVLFHLDLVHALLALVVGAALAAAVFGVTHVIQRRVYQQLQGLLPGGLG